MRFSSLLLFTAQILTGAAKATMSQPNPKGNDDYDDTVSLYAPGPSDHRPAEVPTELSSGHDNYLMRILERAQVESGPLGHASTLPSPAEGSSTAASPATAAMQNEFPNSDLKITTWGLIDMYKSAVHLPNIAFENARSISVTVIPLLARTVASGATSSATNDSSAASAAGSMRNETHRYFGMASDDAAIHSEGNGGDALMGLLFAMVSLGTVAANVPSGMLARLYPLRYVPLACGVIYIFATIALVLIFPNGSDRVVYVTLIATCFLWGVAFSPYSVGRLLFVQHSVPKSWRPGLMSMVGGVQRWAMVSGPFLAGLATDYFPGGMLTALGLQIPLMLANMALLYGSTRLKECSDELEDLKVASRRERAAGDAEMAEIGQQQVSRTNSTRSKEPTFLQEIWDNIFVVLVVGTFAMAIQIMRGNRTMLLTVRALDLGLSASYMGTVLSVSFFVDASLFMLGGYVGSKYGTRVQTVLASGGLGLSFLLLAFQVDQDQYHGLAVFQLITVAVLFGVANSLGAGLVLSLVSSHAPKSKGNGVLTVMRSMQDAGPLVGSLVAGMILEYVTFGWACSVFGVMGIANAVMAGLLVPSIPKEG